MAKGPKVPRTSKEILNRIVVLALDKSMLSGKAIQAKLEEEFDPESIPGLRTVQLYTSNARIQAEKNVQEKRWSLGTMDNAGIPWEAATWLLECYDKCRKRAWKGEQLWRLTNPYPRGTKPPEPVEGGWVYLTNRQAKWLWRVRPIVPAQEFPDPFLDLCHWADQYAHEEITAEYLGQDFDTAAIDANLMMYRDAAGHETATNEGTESKKQDRRRSQ